MVQQSRMGLGVPIIADWKRETCWYVSNFFTYILFYSFNPFVNISLVYIASFFGGIENDTWTLNVDSLWTGGPFQLEVYHSQFYCY